MATGVIRPLGPANSAIIIQVVQTGRDVLLVSEEKPQVVLLVQQVHTTLVSTKRVFQLALLVIIPMNSLILTIGACNAIRATLPIILTEPASPAVDRTQISVLAAVAISTWIQHQ